MSDRQLRAVHPTPFLQDSRLLLADPFCWPDLLDDALHCGAGSELTQNDEQENDEEDEP